MVLGVLLTLGAVIAGATYFACTRGATVEDIATLPLDSSPDQIEKNLYVTWRTDDSVRVTFRPGAAGPYEHVNYRWSNNDFSLPEGMSLFVIEGSKIGPNVVPTLNKSLHGGVDESGSWHWGPASMHVDLATGALHVMVKSTLDDNEPNLLRRRQLTALWQIVRGAAFGGPAVPSEELVAVLGGGYPLAKIAAFDPQTPFGRARSELPKQFPGSRAFDHTAVEIALDHPLLFSVSLSWHNAAEGILHGVHFRVAPEFRKQLTAFSSCLANEVGPAEKTVSDYARGVESKTFHVRGSADIGSVVDMHAGDEADLYMVAHGDRFDRDAWRRAFESIDHCR